MKKVAVRRVNEWDGPSMLKIYAPYTEGLEAFEGEPPELQEYIQRIDRYTYGLGWILCEIDSTPSGFCCLTAARAAWEEVQRSLPEQQVIRDYLWSEPVRELLEREENEDGP